MPVTLRGYRVKLTCERGSQRTLRITAGSNFSQIVKIITYM